MTLNESSDSGARASRMAPKARRSRTLVLLLGGIVLLLVVGSAFWGPLLLRRMDFFHVRRVEIVGVHYLQPSDILARLHVDTMASVWDPTAPLAARVATHPAIQRVAIHRKLPGTLVIDIVERVPVALVPAKDGFRVYDARGTALPIDPARVTVDAPVLAQRDTSLLRLLGAMREQMPAMYARVSSVTHAGAGELLFRFPSEPVRAMQNVTLERLADVEPVEADLRARQIHVAEIDLRFRDQVIARLP